MKFVEKNWYMLNTEKEYENFINALKTQKKYEVNTTYFHTPEEYPCAVRFNICDEYYDIDNLEILYPDNGIYRIYPETIVYDENYTVKIFKYSIERK